MKNSIDRRDVLRPKAGGTEMDNLGAFGEPPRLSDAQVLQGAQAGDHACLMELPYRLGGLGNLDEDRCRGSLIARIAIRATRRYGGNAEMAEEVASRVYAAVLDPDIARFDPERGGVAQYIYGLALNAAKAALPSATREVSVDVPANHAGLSIEDQDAACWAFRKAPPMVRRALARLREGQTLDQAARAAGMSRRSLKRAIDRHIDWCRGMLVASP
jgi:hypothetical protein